MLQYKHLTIQNANPPLDESQIAELERFWGAPIPEDFCEYLRVANGGLLDYGLHECCFEWKLQLLDVRLRAEGAYTIGWLRDFMPDEFLLSEDGLEDGPGRWMPANADEAFSYGGWLPPRPWIPFATSKDFEPYGALYFIDLSLPNAGRVLQMNRFWSLESWSRDELPEKAFEEVAPSFSGFIQQIPPLLSNVEWAFDAMGADPERVERAVGRLEIIKPYWRHVPEIAAAVARARRRAAPRMSLMERVRRWFRD